LHDDLLTRLSNVGDLQVRSRGSVEQYSDGNYSPPAVADSLDVRWIVEGRVQQAGGRVRVYAQLIDPVADANIWADSYQRELTAENLFAIQGEIAGEIAGALQAELSEGEQERIAEAPTENLDAYRLYVQGRQALDQYIIEENLLQAGKYFQRALTEDSTYALAWAGLADAIGYGLDQTSLPDSIRLPRTNQLEAAQNALKYDSELAEAYTALGHAYFQQHNTPIALKSFKLALELKPSYAEAHSWLASVYYVLDQPKNSLKHLQLAEQLNPQNMLARHRLFDDYIRRGLHEKALEEVRKVQRRFNYPGAIWAEARTLASMGRYEEAIAIAEKRLSNPISKFERFIMRGYLIEYEAAIGDTAQARAHMNELKQITLTPEERSRWSIFYVGPRKVLEDQDAVIEAYQDQSAWEWFGGLPTISLRDLPERMPAVSDDPRYQELVREVNQYWSLNPDGSIPENIDIPDDEE
jgi:TolB-like protein